MLYNTTFSFHPPRTGRVLFRSRSAPSAPDNALRARRIVEDSTLVRRDECNTAMRVLSGALKLMIGCRA
jgi:hypothetical protein